ncbi:MAG TPA: Crp/Fnr family transcriptional regulator [Candidatus Saccharimonadales bacterium]|jgi:CRP/FNR family transcriptional regulator
MLAKASQSARLVDLFKVSGLKQTFKKGDYIIRPGDTPSGVYFIEQGLVKAYDITKYKEENLLIIRKENEIFPLIWAITGQERHVVYQSLAPQTITWRIDRNLLLDCINKEPEIMAPLLDMTVEMYRLHSERILNLEYRTVRERIISFLLTMSQRYAVKQTKDGLMITVPLRHQDIASSINASRETTSRELSALDRKGLVTSQQSFIILKDPAALRQHLR